MTIYYQDNHVALYHGDCLDVLAAMPDSSVDSIVTDPPYGLSNTTPAQVAETITHWVSGDREYLPTGRGFMGKEWDGFVPPVAVWDECLRVLKPGGHMAVFAGSRTHDLMTLSIRFAGFEIRDSLAWLYGSGFPKSMDVGKAIDKLAGAEREVIRARTYEQTDGGGYSGNLNTSKPRSESSEITAPATPEAVQWDGWGTALKPGHEPIVLARKPLAEKTVARNVLEHGTGGINIDACRIATDDQVAAHRGTANPRVAMGDGWGEGYQVGESATTPPNTAGRWPANVLLDEHAAAWVDEQSGNLSVNGPGVYRREQEDASETPSSFQLGKPSGHHRIGYGDSGGASRFFYTAKAPKSERPNVDGIQHPTVKPLAIMRWLIRLVTPPGGTVLDPFAGSGTTIEAAMIEGFHPIGIEKETEYLPLITARITRAKTSAQGVLDLGDIA